jgi:hypothetical protein
VVGDAAHLVRLLRIEIPVPTRKASPTGLTEADAMHERQAAARMRHGFDLKVVADIRCDRGVGVRSGDRSN